LQPFNRPPSTATAARSSLPPPWRPPQANGLRPIGRSVGSQTCLALPAPDGRGADLGPISRAEWKNRQVALPKPVVTLDPETSGRQRDELLVEGRRALVVRRRCPMGQAIKHTWTAADARQVEAALEIKLADFGDGVGGPAPVSDPRTGAPTLEPSPHSTAETSHTGGGAPCSRITSPLVFEDYAVTPKTRRRRDKRHRQFAGRSYTSGCQSLLIRGVLITFCDRPPPATRTHLILR
jgi:hypothetical protein